MTNRTTRKTNQVLWALGLCIALGSACGGRAVTVEEGGSGAVGATVGSGATAGAGAVSGAGGLTIGVSGNVGTAGSVSGGASSAGSSSAGAPNSCPKYCPAISCDSNSRLVFPNGACCPSCVSSCPPCPDIQCPSGYQAQTQQGQCCPSCVPSGVDCATGQKAYSALEMQFADKYKFGCATNADCVADAPANACEPSCSNYPIARSSLPSWQMNLASEAARDCSSCPPAAPLPCAPPPPVTCVNNQCQIAVFL